MGIPSNTTKDSLFTDKNGKVWRLAWMYSEPTICMEEVFPPAGAEPIRKIGIGASFSDFRQLTGDEMQGYQPTGRSKRASPPSGGSSAHRPSLPRVFC